MKYTSVAGRAAEQALSDGERLSLDQMDALAMDWLRYWQRRYRHPVRLEPAYGICEGWFRRLMPRFLVRALVESGRWAITRVEVPSANGRGRVHIVTLHPVASTASLTAH